MLDKINKNVIATYSYKFFSDMCLIIWIRIVGVHEFDGVENANGIEGVVVLVDVVFHHYIKEIPVNDVIRSYSFVSIYKKQPLIFVKFN